MRTILLCGFLVHASACTDRNDDNGNTPQQATGQGETVSTAGDDPNNPFFTALGTNGRSCATCHAKENGWSVSAAALQARFDASGGGDPMFRPVDGSTSPSADVSTLAAQRTAYGLLLTKGVIRVGRPIPSGAEFSLASVTDPYGFASAAELSLFRRPLPATNLRFLSQTMWDAREATLATQATDATLGHAEAATVDANMIAQIVAFESSNYTAERTDDVAGDLASDGASGGAQGLVTLAFHVGLNDPSESFDRQVFTLFEAWANADTSTAQGQRRASIARGERIFNTHPLDIRGVAGLPDQQGTCSTCHNTPNVGSHSMALPLNIGVADANDDDNSDLPHYTLRNNTSGQTITTTDPGYALTTGLWEDIGKFKVPALRGVVMRAPYFHNGRAASLDDVVQFYTQRFRLRLDDGEQADLVAFLESL